jgi:hypothetical protein
MNSEADYHQDYEHVSKSMLSHFLHSPAAYARYYINQVEKPPQPAGVSTGSIVHEVVLNGRSLFDDVLHIYPDDCLNKSGRLIGENAKAFRESLGPEQYAVKEQEAEQIQQVVSAARSIVQRLQVVDDRPSVFEQAIRWEAELLTGDVIKCRCKPDMLQEYDEMVVVTDLKISEQPTPDDFRRVSSRFHYWLQDAHYSAGVAAKYGKPVLFRFLVVENSMNPRCGCYQYNEISRDASVGEWELILADIANRKKTGDWSDKWTQEVTYLDLKPWETKYTEREENELDAVNWSE